MFHPGELAVQKAVGVSDVAAVNSKLIWSSIPDHVVPFIAAQSNCVIGGASVEGDIWAEFVTGNVGFATVGKGGRTVTLSGVFGTQSQRRLDLLVGHHVGVLFIDLLTRKRLRVNGTVAAISRQDLTLAIDQAFPNCPKYVQARRLTASGVSNGRHAMTEGVVLPDHAVAWIERSDMFFVASAAIDGHADVSHRGGKPGFVTIIGQTLLVPDYSGNSMFSTLGNFLVRPLAGLVFLDFEANQMLQLTGDITLDFDAKGAMPASIDTGRCWKFEVKKFVISAMEPGVSAEFIGASPFNPAVVVEP